MRLQHFDPDPQLVGYVSKIWVFESSGRVPHDGMKLIVPNGMVKITIPFRNGTVGRIKDTSYLSKESNITLIGISDIPDNILKHVEKAGDEVVMLKTNTGMEAGYIGMFMTAKETRSAFSTCKLFCLLCTFNSTRPYNGRIISNA